jgi:hypothetical protein
MDSTAEANGIWISSFSAYTFTTILTTLLVVALMKRYRFVKRCDKLYG